MLPDFFKAPILMGILNITPDSFYDGGRNPDLQTVLKRAHEMVQGGAQILDIGGESTRPGASIVSLEEEQERVIPVITALSNEFPETLVSIDTRNATTMRKAIEAGAGMINDVTALTHDPGALDVVSEYKIPVCLMHMKGKPGTMQRDPHYDDAPQEVYDYLKERRDLCIDAGLDQKQIILDPGIGFGKTLKHNLSLLNQIDKFHALGCPVMLGASRKSFIDKVIPDTSAEDRLPGSLAAAIWAYQKGVQIFRVHDVPETAQAIEIYRNIKNIDYT